MSFNSRHMFNPAPLGYYCVTYKYDSKVLKDVPWENLLVEDIHTDGNTKWTRDKPSLAFIKNNLFLGKAAKELGYARPDATGSSNIAKRVRKNGIGNLMALLEALIAAGKMPQNCSALFQRRKRPAKLAIEFTNEIISKTIKAYGSRKMALRKLGIDESLARWWESRL